MPADPYAVLGVSAQASGEEVVEAYRALAQIYHPDRYAEAPARVRTEATARMQAVNAAYEQLRSSVSRRTAGPSSRADTAAGRPARARSAARPNFVYYVDGAKGYHDGAVAPLGFVRDATGLAFDERAPRCSKLDAELRAWFDLQRRNADLAAQQLYSVWTPEEQASYAATLGCSQVARDGAQFLGVACGECRA